MSQEEGKQLLGEEEGRGAWFVKQNLYLWLSVCGVQLAPAVGPAEQPAARHSGMCLRDSQPAQVPLI